MEMKANDVRLKNLVKYQGKVYEIAAITEESPYLNTTEFGDGIVEWSDLQGVELTEEWLLKFGFTKSFAVTNFAIQIEAGVLDLTPSEIVGYHVYIDDNWICTIESVHELQNLYMAICGKELKIKL